MLQCNVARHPEQLPALVESAAPRSTAQRGANADPPFRENIAELGRHLNWLGVPVPALLSPNFLRRLPGRHSQVAANADAQRVADCLLQKLAHQHAVLIAMRPHIRSYMFADFLRDLLDAFGLAPRSSIRYTGNKIDGRFELDLAHYLLSARWQDAPSCTDDLVTFAQQVQEHGPWARGVFISNAGFCPQALETFGQHHPIVCVDGLDLHRMFRRKLGFDDVLRTKLNHAAATGRPFVRVRGLLKKNTPPASLR